jgi:hypothetical protein
MGLNGFRGDNQIQLALGVIGHQPLGLLKEQTQLGFITCRAHMAEDPSVAIDGFGGLDRRRARGGASTSGILNSIPVFRTVNMNPPAVALATVMTATCLDGLVSGSASHH